MYMLSPFIKGTLETFQHFCFHCCRRRDRDPPAPAVLSLPALRVAKGFSPAPHAFTKIAVSDTPLLVQIRRHPARAAAACSHPAVGGAAGGRSENGDMLCDGKYRCTSAMMSMPPGLIFGSRNSVT